MSQKSSPDKLLTVDDLENWTTVECRGSPDGDDDLTKSDDYAMSIKVQFVEILVFKIIFMNS